MKRLCVAMLILMTIVAVGCGNNKVADGGAASSTVSEPEAVPMIIDNGVFTDIGYNIPKSGEAEIETNWEWLYGKINDYSKSLL